MKKALNLTRKEVIPTTKNDSPAPLPIKNTPPLHNKEILRRVEQADKMKEDENYIEGTCLQMCPKSEIEMRMREKLVHELERSHGELIKCFKRSAAGICTSDPELLRPPHVLQSTITYLFNEILTDETKPFHTIYRFVEDRLKAVRQDLFIQQPPPRKCFPVLEPIVRFYAYSAYRLSESHIKDFDPVLNHNQLLETFKWLLKLYDSCDHLSPERIEMESLYALFNLGEPSSLFRTLNLSSQNRHSLVLLSEEMSMAWYLGNYAKISKKMYELPVLLTALAFAVQQPYIQKYALKVMSAAYSSKTLVVPLSYIKQQLLFNNENQLSDYLISCGLETTNQGVKFAKNNNIDKLPLNKKWDYIEHQLREVYLPDLLLTTPITS